MKILDKIYNTIKINNVLILFLLSTIIVNFLIQFFILNEDSYYRSYNNQLSSVQIEKVLNLKIKLTFISYIILIIFNLFKFSFITFLINLGAFIFEIKLSPKKIFEIVVISEFIFLIALLIKFAWFYLFKSSFVIQEFGLFYPLSLTNLLEINNIDNIWIYPLQLLNVFELTYWIALAYGISKLINNNFDKALKIVLSSYVPALVVWVVFVMFLTVTLNPS